MLPRPPPPPAFALVASILLGCGAPVGVDRAGFDDVHAQTAGDVLTTGGPSAYSIDVLRRYALHDRFEEAPDEVLRSLHQVAVGGPDRDVVFALAELSYLAADDLDDGRPAFLAAACYSWLYLFDAPPAGWPDPFDPRFRLACDVYGYALARAFLDDDGDAFLAAEGPRTLAFSESEVDVEVDGSRLPYEEGIFDVLVPARAFEVHGIANRHRRAGLGAPLIATHRERLKLLSVRERLKRPKAAPVTAVLRLDGGLRDLVEGRVDARLVLLDALDESSFRVGDVVVPLETDVSAALGYGLQRSGIFDLELSSFFGGADVEDYSGLYAFRAYRPDKIPVVFVHGTSSSLARWADMFNDLMADDLLRERYQFWFFTYLSGRPIPLSAIVLRDSLLDARARFDPEGDDPAFDDAVLIAHSQGGLLVRQMVVDDRDNARWDALFSKPLDEFEGEEETLALLREAFFAPPVPFVRRAVYISTPHRGSFLADRWLGRAARSLVTLPKRALTVTTDLLTRNRDALRHDVDSDVPTSIDSMQTDNPFLLALAELPAAHGVHQHSIIAIDGDEQPPDGDDGVVEYTSARLDGVDSEFLVRSYHSCQSHALTIAEVRRILREHLAEFDEANGLSARARR